MSTDLWKDFQVEIQKELDLYPNNFLQAPVIAKTMHPSIQSLCPGYEQAAYKMLQYVSDPSWGSPSLSKNRYSLASLQCAYYLQLIKNHFNIEFNQLQHIVDIGGGYGNMYRAFRNAEYDGKYQIIDFPVVHKLQLRFLSQVFSDLSNLDQIPLDMEKARPVGKSLLIATHSINEMPLNVRSIIEPHYSSYDYILINHNYDFAGVDNVKYFNGIVKQLEDTHKCISFICPVTSRHHIKLLERK